MTKTITKKNRILIPKKVCHYFGSHKWFWEGHNHSLLAGLCARCGMKGGQFWDLERAEMAKRRKKRKEQNND